MKMPTVLSINLVLIAIICLCSSNIDATEKKQQDVLDNFTESLKYGGSKGNCSQRIRSIDEILIDNQLALSSKMEKLTEKLEQLKSLQEAKKKPKKLLCDPCANVMPDTIQERYVELGNRHFTLFCESARSYGSGWHFVVRVTDITKFVPVSFKDFEEGFKIDDENFFIGMNTLHQLTTSTEYEMRVHRNEYFGRWEAIEVGSPHHGLYRISKLGYFVGSESLNTLTRNFTTLGKPYTYVKTDLGACTFEENNDDGVCNIGIYIKTQAQRAKHFGMQIRRRTHKLYN